MRTRICRFAEAVVLCMIITACGGESDKVTVVQGDPTDSGVKRTTPSTEAKRIGPPSASPGSQVQVVTESAAPVQSSVQPVAGALASKTVTSGATAATTLPNATATINKQTNVSPHPAKVGGFGNRLYDTGGTWLGLFGILVLMGMVWFFERKSQRQSDLQSDSRNKRHQ